ncbi:hypothetical protein KAW65_00305 [candidate division WOR-3 bacterium]|nr:hypothetical protein [candidate division WOR-3 bacterium]
MKKLKRLTDAEAEAFMYFLESERIRHLEDIKMIEKKQERITKRFAIKRPMMDWRDWWVK